MISDLENNQISKNLPQKRKAKRFGLWAMLACFGLGSIFGGVVKEKLLTDKKERQVGELEQNVRECIDNMEDKEFYDFAKRIVVYHYNLENPETPITTEQVKIEINDGSNPQNHFKLQLRKRDDGTKYYEQINLEEEKQTKNGIGKVMTVRIKDSKNGYTIKTYKAARGGFFRQGNPIDVYEPGEDTSISSFLTEEEYVYDILAEAITIYHHNNEQAARKQREKIIYELPSYYLDILNERVKAGIDFKQERIEGITVSESELKKIEDDFGVQFDFNAQNEQGRDETDR